MRFTCQVCSGSHSVNFKDSLREHTSTSSILLNSEFVLQENATSKDRMAQKIRESLKDALAFSTEQVVKNQMCWLLVLKIECVRSGEEKILPLNDVGCINYLTVGWINGTMWKAFRVRFLHPRFKLYFFTSLERSCSF